MRYQTKLKIAILTLIIAIVLSIVPVSFERLLIQGYLQGLTNGMVWWFQIQVIFNIATLSLLIIWSVSFVVCRHVYKQYRRDKRFRQQQKPKYMPTTD